MATKINTLPATWSNNPPRLTAEDTSQLRGAVRLIAESYYGQDGIWLCDAFEAINTEGFGSALPYPLITIEITPHGGCLGLTKSCSATPPRIKIHPTLFALRERGERTPWSIDPAWLGRRFAFDVLIHEMMHVSVGYILPLELRIGNSSHDNRAWTQEVNRIAPLIGYADIQAEPTKVQRVVVPGEFTDSGNPMTRLKRVSNSNVPNDAVYGFPRGLRRFIGDADSYYRKGRLPLDV